MCARISPIHIGTVLWLGFGLLLVSGCGTALPTAPAVATDSSVHSVEDTGSATQFSASPLRGRQPGRGPGSEQRPGVKKAGW